MTPEVVNLIQACAWAPSQFLILSDNVFAKLIYYSHFSAIIPTLLLAFFIFINGRKDLAKILLLITMVFFSLWVFGDLVLWATEYPTYTMFFWTLINIFEPLVYFFCFYFFYVYVFKKDFSFLQKIIFALPLIPTLVFAPSKLMLLGYDISNCDRAAVEGILATYGYGIEILYILLIVGFAIFAIVKATDWSVKRHIILITLGITLFLLSFSFGNMYEVFSQNWYVGQYGLFGAPVFVGFLAYLIVKYHAFNVRLIGAQALVTGLWLSVLSLLFIRTVDDVRIVTSITLIFVLIAGILLVRGVYREIEQREKIEKLAKELQETNEQQERLMHFIGHEVKGFLTKDAGAFAALADGDFGQLQDGMKPFVASALAQTREGVDSVTNLLIASNMKKGTTIFKEEPFDLAALAADVVQKMKQSTEKKGLTITLIADYTGVPYMVTGDKAEIGDHVLRNLIDNAIHYTSSGAINVSLKKESNRIIFSVKDSGVGITDEDKKRLFTEGGYGKDSQTINAHSTGYGLFIAKNIVVAHGGTIRAESEGQGKGSTFIVEFPV